MLSVVPQVKIMRDRYSHFFEAQVLSRPLSSVPKLQTNAQVWLQSILPTATPFRDAMLSLRRAWATEITTFFRTSPLVNSCTDKGMQCDTPWDEHLFSSFYFSIRQSAVGMRLSLRPCT